MPPRINEVGVYLDEFTDADGSVEVKVADRGCDTLAAAPPRRGSVSGPVDPLDYGGAVDDSEHAHIGRLDIEALARLLGVLAPDLC
jgi:hypothetical protein